MSCGPGYEMKMKAEMASAQAKTGVQIKVIRSLKGGWTFDWFRFDIEMKPNRSGFNLNLQKRAEARNHGRLEGWKIGRCKVGG
jgi:hypothetical protein